MSERSSEPVSLNFNPMSPAFIADPYPTYAQLREHAPVLKTPLGFWLTSRHEDVSLVVRDRRFGKGFSERMTKRYGADHLKEPAIRSLGFMMLVQDPPVHSRLRGLVTKAFTSKRIEQMRERIEQLANELIDDVEGAGQMDVLADFAHKLPVHVICDMLGIPEAHRERFLGSSQVSGRLIDPTPLSEEELAFANERTAASEAYFHSLFDHRRKTPGSDLTSHLVQVEEAGDHLTDDEMTSNIILLFAAGHETTSNLIGNGLLALFRHPDQLALMRSGQLDWGDAVEELLRFDSSVQMTSRTTKEAVEIGGVEIPAGEQVIALLGAANHDPSIYESPERLDLTRSGVRAMSFGGGIHICLGARLARLEGEVAFQTLMKRLPKLELPETNDVAWRNTFTLRGLQRLVATW
ncbi:MAG: cytochrome P450 [Gammaproteobacteria bacterium]|nr:cytochrome P450 [Gammaproteobacteria bacterium]